MSADIVKVISNILIIKFWTEPTTRIGEDLNAEKEHPHHVEASDEAASGIKSVSTSKGKVLLLLILKLLLNLTY